MLEIKYKFFKSQFKSKRVLEIKFKSRKSRLSKYCRRLLEKIL